MSSQSSHDRLVLQYLALAIKGYDLEGYRDTSLRKTHERLNSTGAKAYRCARATVFGAVPMGGTIHTCHTARSHAKRCMEAYRLDAFNCPEIEDDGFDYDFAAEVINGAFTSSVTDETIDFSLDSVLDSFLDAVLESIFSEALSPIPFVGSAIAAARIPKAMKRLLRVPKPTKGQIYWQPMLPESTKEQANQ
ncbi:hypothetical protein BGW38_010447 [Lunasporangiospora selenospora]|uniref:Uncharacterized protein n=1 Tax=Lunasporangiospora selenospora TaxID=979761 RepID=A0A9P6KFQ1_9FUNG|nr:hypothetical protein BGW38_010447 [Lunasporangiospora selenospora]